MNRSLTTVSKQLIIAFALLTSNAFLAQEERKTFQERFIVAEDAVVNINTSYADIEFETWDKDEVAITATITLEGATKEEAENYFKNSPIEILGNSKEIKISSKSKNNDFFTSFDSENIFNHGGMRIAVPEIASFVVSVPQIAPFPEMPPLPLTEAYTFDYEEYQKDGDKYMKKWQKNFEKSFDKKHQKRLEEWAERMEEQAEEMEIRMEEHNAKRAELMEERHEALQQRLEEREEKRAHLQSDKDEHRAFIHTSRNSSGEAPNIFYYSSEGEQKNFKIKKTIKISLPKSTRIKMDVRHGEVKLAENTKNLNAKLSHSSLWAVTIDGEETSVSASYSPVTVQKWNYGQLSTSYSEDISLSEVVQLQLQATSSEVTIDKLFKNAFVKNDFGAVHILEMGNDFEELDISVRNGELTVTMPKVATNVYVKGNSSTLKLPTDLQIVETKNGTTTIHKGYHLKNNSNRSIVITSDYSEVVLH
ncbi:hypothetical protein SAMN04488007_1943 [Maribacter aquivivus]|uniref:Adhesin domain-containing protein n=1 Tax=Maribacter aquivivus TaxID=228958 RepID=A0A1M6N812_9FLAO|nr:hypothetical protein [Maribacter aquivivus]SHJ91802.1 hypothetical protein SAMN04488007_1943 [Maribacter aquivivus]